MSVLPFKNGHREMTQYEWLQYGIKHGFCSEIVCNTHDGLPSSGEEEDAEWEEGGDPCVPAVRIFELEV
jgi:hypothetical protein